MDNASAPQAAPVALSFCPRKFVYRSVDPCPGSPMRRKTDPERGLAAAWEPERRPVIALFRFRTHG